MWLRDGMAMSQDNVRFITFGHDPGVGAIGDLRTIDSLAMSLIWKLKSIGRSSLSAKPLVFFAHSLGGIVLKRAMIELANNGQHEEFMLNIILGAVFFAVPNQFTSITTLRSMIPDSRLWPIADGLAANTTYLSTLDEKFGGVAQTRSMKIFSVFETRPSQTLPRFSPLLSDTSNDRSKATSAVRTELKSVAVIIDRDVAVQGGTHQSNILPIAEDHASIIALKEGSPDIQVIAKILESFLKTLSPEPSTTRGQAIISVPTNMGATAIRLVSSLFARKFEQYKISVDPDTSKKGTPRFN
jgi:hypothetical protein